MMPVGLMEWSSMVRKCRRFWEWVEKRGLGIRAEEGDGVQVKKGEGEKVRRAREGEKQKK